jgi:periplasmic divalent cation tolerance protein
MPSRPNRDPDQAPDQGQDVFVVLVTAPPDKAPGIAEALVAERVAACVNIVPGLQSVYRWKGDVERASESLLVIKTTRDRFEAVKRAVLKHHAYELPEVVGIPVEKGHIPYLDWVVESTR